jgi:hypothetical protein
MNIYSCPIQISERISSDARDQHDAANKVGEINCASLFIVIVFSFPVTSYIQCTLDGVGVSPFPEWAPILDLGFGVRHIHVYAHVQLSDNDPSIFAFTIKVALS